MREFTYEKRLGVVNTDPSVFPGVKIAGKYWWSKGAKRWNGEEFLFDGRPIVCVMPDNWEGKFDNMQSLPPGVTVAMGARNEMVVIKPF